MAGCPSDENRGYDGSRFESVVDRNFNCAICLNVVKDGRTCPNNDHIFCRECIEEHLRVNPQRCPECQEELTVQLLRRARIVNNYIATLRIKCDYANRGCPEFTTVEDLQSHVENCDYVPVLCSNELCGEELNKRDRIHHETHVCQYRKMAWDDYGKIRENVETLQKSVNTLEDKMKTVILFQLQMEQEVRAKFLEVNDNMEEKFNVLRSHLDDERQKTKRDMEKMRKEMVQSGNAMNESRIEVYDVTLTALSIDLDKLKAMMMQLLEKMNMKEQFSHKLPSPTEEMINTARNDILIAGGYMQSSAEIFLWKEKQWIEISSMNEIHSGASSFIHNDQLFAVGGWGSTSLEKLDLSQLILRWRKFPGELNEEIAYHRTVVCEQRILCIGGYNCNLSQVVNLISEYQLTPPFTMKVLGHMTEPRRCHGVEIVDDKVLIFGGQSEKKKALSSVLEFDLNTNTCKEMPSLDHPLTSMATAVWRDKVLLLGGRGYNAKCLNHVIVYDSKTGKSSVAPSMLEKRSECCAVVTGDTVVVLGGENDEGKDLDSVECFHMDSSSTWKYLPPMNHARSQAVAQVLPSRRNYVQHLPNK